MKYIIIHKLAATLQGVMLNGMPLTKHALDNLPLESQRYIASAQKLLLE